MLDINGFLKICDFGLCAVYKHKGMERRLTERCGSLPYVAPEVNLYNDASQELRLPNHFQHSSYSLMAISLITQRLLMSGDVV